MELTLQGYYPVIDDYEIDDIIHIEGICKDALFISNDNRYGIYRFEDMNQYTFPVLSNTTAFIKGQSYFLRGKVLDYNGEKELKLYDFIPYKPTTKHAILSFLRAIPGLQGKAEMIYDKFGEKCIDVVISDPTKLHAIKGIGKKTIEKVKESNVGVNVNYQTILKLFELGFTTNQVIKTINYFGEAILFRLMKNPYQLMNVPSFSFQFCDKVARKLGMNFDNPFRMNAAGIDILEKASYEGNVYLPNDEFLPLVQELLSVAIPYEELQEYENQTSISYFGKTYELDSEKMKQCVEKKTEYTLEKFTKDDILSYLKTSIVEENERVYLKKLYNAEVGFAEHILNLIENRECLYTKDEVERMLDNICKKEQIDLEQKQKEAVILACQYDSGVVILNGSAGTGKTFVTKMIVKTKKALTEFYHPNEEITFLGLAPTGKAAKVMNKSMAELYIPCKTIHSALGYNGTEFIKDAKHPLEEDFFIVDESSMIDISLANSFTNAVPKKSMVVFLGDTKQLASVGPGSVLKDMINSGKVPMITLNVVKRQTALSGILKNAEHVIAKEPLETTPVTDDFYLMNTCSNEEIQETVVKSIARLYEKGFTLEDIQLLIPQRTGEIGIYYFNYILQKELNKYHKGLSVLKTTFNVKGKEYQLFICKNDKVMQIRNDGGKQLFLKKNGVKSPNPDKLGITNGEIGTVSDIYVNKKGETVVEVNYEGYYTEYTEVSDLELAYAVTIHKSQGSQWPATLIVVGNSHKHMLSNNILYTAITRSVDFCGVIYNEKALDYAIKTEKDSKRYTSLEEMLRKF